MRILILQPGIGSYRVDFFNMLAERCHLKLVYYLDDSSGQVFNVDIKKQLVNCEIEKLTGGFFVGDSPINLKLFKIIDEFKPDVVITHEYRPMSLLLALFKRVLFKKFKLFVWSSDSVTHVKNCRPLRKVSRALLSTLANGIMVYSQESLEAYCQFTKISKRKLFICPNVQSSTRIRAEVSAAGEGAELIRQKYKLEGKNVVLFVGRLEKEKNLIRLFNAFAQANLSNTVLLVVGSGSQEQLLAGLTEQLGLVDKIILHGQAEAQMLAAFYALADLLVLPSLSETFGAVVNESLAIGKAVIVSKNAGSAVLIRSEKQGERIDPKSEKSIADALQRRVAMLGANEIVKENLMPWDLPEFVESFLNFTGKK